MSTLSSEGAKERNYLAALALEKLPSSSSTSLPVSSSQQLQEDAMELNSLHGFTIRSNASSNNTWGSFGKFQFDQTPGTNVWRSSSQDVGAINPLQLQVGEGDYPSHIDDDMEVLVMRDPLGHTDETFYTNLPLRRVRSSNLQQTHPPPIGDPSSFLPPPPPI